MPDFLEKYEFNLVGTELYNFIWNEFCDWYIELSKINMNNTSKTINSSNVSENLPNTGLSSAELNLALILLLALVFGMFSLVQYNKIVKKDNEE